MCSIEEAWAGQNFDGHHVSSQGDIHNAYMSIPDNVLNRGNEFNVSNPNQPQPRTLSRGINSKLSREPRIPNRTQNTNNIDINMSSIMPSINNYGGLEPLPSYMSIYNNNANTTDRQQSTQSTQPYPSPTMTGENFTDVNSAFNLSDTLNNFMNRGRGSDNFDDLIEEDTIEEENIINNKFNNMKKNNNKNEFSNINSKNNKQTNSNSDRNSNSDSDSDSNIHMILIDILNKLNKIEKDLHNNNKRNMCDVVLYIIVGMLLSFIIYSILSGNRK